MIERVRIRRVNVPLFALAGHSFCDVYWLNFVLFFEHMTVAVRGQNLQPVVVALENGTADFIQQYHHDLWPKPSDENAPLIETIEIIIRGEQGEFGPA